MTPQCKALIVALVVVFALIVAAPEIHGEEQSYVESVVCAPQYRWDCQTALSIVWRESNNQSWAINPYSEAAGWWQIMPLHNFRYAHDPVLSTQYAYSLWLYSGWEAWR